MSMVYGTNTELLGMYSEMIGDSTFVVRTRKTKNGEKLLVDVTEITSKEFRLTNQRRIQARQAARHYGAASIDYGMLAPWVSSRKLSDASGTIHSVTMCHTTFVFTLAN